MSLFTHSITLGGKPFLGYKSFSISYSLDSIVPTATIEFEDFTMAYAEEQGKLLNIAYGQYNLFKGYVSSVSRSYDGNSSHSFNLTARGLFADLADSSVGDSKAYKSKDYLGIIQTAIQRHKAPSNILLKLKNTSIAPLTKEEKEKILPEESAFNLIQEYAKKRQHMLFVRTDGSLVISDNPYLLGDKHSLNGGKGFQVKSIAWQSNRDALFYTYSYITETGNGAAKPSKKGSKTKLSTGKVTSTLGYVRANRETCVNIRTETDAKLARDKNVWRKTNAEANEFDLSLSLYDFAQRTTKKLIRIGDYVDFVDEHLGITGLFLVKTADYNFSETEGHTLSLGLKLPASFIPEPPDELTKAQRRRRGNQKNKKKKKKDNKLSIVYGKTTLDNLLK